MLLKVKGIRTTTKQSKKLVEVVVKAESKQEVWNNPSDFGFTKVFKVTKV